MGWLGAEAPLLLFIVVIKTFSDARALAHVSSHTNNLTGAAINDCPIHFAHQPTFKITKTKFHHLHLHLAGHRAPNENHITRSRRGCKQKNAFNKIKKDPAETGS